MKWITCLALSACFGAPCIAAETLLVPPEDSVAGHSQAEWSRRWWQWAGSFEQQRSPIADQTGEFCMLKQQGNVWFLAGTYGTRRTVRACTVPRDKYLFFPLINYVVMPPADRPIPCGAAVTQAAYSTQPAFNLVLDLDGERFADLEAHRQATPGCFDMGEKAEPRTRIYPSAANGYYIMLRPLPPGRHTLNFGGALPSMLQAVTYTLNVQ